MPKGNPMGYAPKTRSRVKAANGALTPTPDEGHGIKNRGKYSSNRIPDRVPYTGSGGEGSGPGNGKGGKGKGSSKKMKY